MAPEVGLARADFATTTAYSLDDPARVMHQGWAEFLVAALSEAAVNHSGGGKLINPCRRTTQVLNKDLCVVLA